MKRDDIQATQDGSIGFTVRTDLQLVKGDNCLTILDPGCWAWFLRLRNARADFAAALQVGPAFPSRTPPPGQESRST